VAGKPIAYSLKDSLAKGPVVVYFYPSAFTSGCSIQARAFAEKRDRFTAAGASIVGLSLDGIERLNEFSADPNTCAGKLTMASDADGRIARSYDIKVSGPVKGAKDTRGVEIGHGFAERTTFVVKPDGTIAATLGDLSPEANVQKALETVQRLSTAAK
jgi:peroxiredoxin